MLFMESYSPNSQGTNNSLLITLYSGFCHHCCMYRFYFSLVASTLKPVEWKKMFSGLGSSSDISMSILALLTLFRECKCFCLSILSLQVRKSLMKGGIYLLRVRVFPNVEFQFDNCRGIRTEYRIFDCFFYLFLFYVFCTWTTFYVCIYVFVYFFYSFYFFNIFPLERIQFYSIRAFSRSGCVEHSSSLFCLILDYDNRFNKYAAANSVYDFFLFLLGAIYF